ncbi:MAG TPA: flagellar biosynthetic protein FliR [Firmicutes bacterium]|nr:flagellar biosynthetic protein FliR [Bacillota bacterium]
MELSSIIASKLILFVIVLARVGGMFVYAPVFGSFSVPVRVRVVLALIFSAIIVPLVPAPPGAYTQDVVYLTAMILHEVGVGLVIGFTGGLFLVAVQLAGQFIDFQVGFGFVNIVDPVSMRQVTVVGQLSYLLGTLFFLAVNGHHLLISALMKSYEIVPAGRGALALAEPGIMQLFGKAFAIGFKIASPVMVAVFLADAAMGVLARTVPQLNIFIVGFPVKIVGGLLMFALSLPLILVLLGGLFSGIERDILLILRRISTGGM